MTTALALACIVAGFVAAAVILDRLSRPVRFDVHADQAMAVVADRHPSSLRPMRCLVCVDAPMVADFRAHSAVHHVARPQGPDDDPAFLRTLGGAS
jgi:hypothetical protein